MDSFLCKESGCDSILSLGDVKFLLPHTTVVADNIGTGSMLRIPQKGD